ncbi:NeuD/PglB/VioB family sugar acetyltransferase [Cryobacterium psychrophilum]|uniref:Acetyltransferase n=1 Tax=Cryobacterium psychrophilum TaxID=41988 RepID=A0A4Y8KKS7_9MICO|nr:NeuD/PglB/VioB family sugar acetyltransferase [Cryobacterium psychrophilum]TDW29947.1 sugar O-acyltransferase (sialic acid O-acetyltransferase NeuD family) [Cryobacterium psychrophilum]TFD76510.1 acetyltransferase [Cryobacterium psychrophilum]
MSELLLIGASGLAREVLSLLRTQSDSRTVLFVDDDPALWGTTIDGAPVVGGLSEVTNHPTAQIVICVGRGAGRAALIERLGVTPGRYARVIHRSVEVPDSCRVGAGSILLAGVVLTTDVHIGDHVVVMPNVTMTHGNRVDSLATLCAGVTLGGDVFIGTMAYLGMNASVRERVRIGQGAVLGMGSAVLQDVPDRESWVGVPARRLAATADDLHVPASRAS